MKSLALLVLLILALPFALAADPDANLKDKAITTAPGKVCELLRQWWKEGSAAGNVGDFYDNRDGSHSDLNMAPYPQLQKIVYSADDVKFRRHWAAQRVLLPHVVFGNSSTSAPPTAGGSNPRSYYTSSAGLAFLYKQYTGNNLYIYPEHRDHDPGHNGKNDGFGDLYPTNTPYLIISQGSSGSDQPFMRAIPFTLAAFRPEVKKKLTETGLVMPTLQMILRRTSKNLKDPADYLTAKAHPTVFEGGAVNELAMVQMAHDLQADNLPPMIHLKVLEEDQQAPGRDFFDLHNSEKLADTPAVIARVFRGKERQRKMLVSAADSYDVNRKALSFSWVLLRGDPDRVKITPRGKGQAEAEITVTYQERRPIAPGSNMESNRVDIGVFAHNGTYYSAPGFITWFSLDNEARTYDEKGRIVEMGYGVGETSFSISNWNAFLETATSERFPARLLNLLPEHREALRRVKEVLPELQKHSANAAEELKQAEIARKKLQGDKAVTEEERKKGDALVQAAQKKLADANKTISDLLEGKSKETPISARALAEKKIQELAADPRLRENQALSELILTSESFRRTTLADMEKKMFGLGLAAAANTAPPGVVWTRFDRVLLQRYHGVILSAAVFQGNVAASFQANFVDQRLTAAREWRDVYRYGPKDVLLGWTRYDGKAAYDFTADGLLVEAKDPQGRPLKAREVRFVQDPLKTPGLNSNPLRHVAGDRVVTFEYAGPDDLLGKIKSKEKAP